MSTFTTFVAGTKAKASEVNTNFDFGSVPINGSFDWFKTSGVVSSGAADTDTTDKLVNSGATFISDGVVAGMIVQNTTAGTFAVIDSVDSETSLTLRADTQAGSSTTDIFPSGTGNYEIYATMELPENMYELNGQTISDAESKWNGLTLPDTNVTKRFMRGSNKSGATGGADTHTHTFTSGGPSGGSNSYQLGTGPYSGHTHSGTTDSGSTLPAYMEAVRVIRIK